EMGQFAEVVQREVSATLSRQQTLVPATQLSLPQATLPTCPTVTPSTASVAADASSVPPPAAPPSPPQQTNIVAVSRSADRLGSRHDLISQTNRRWRPSHRRP